MTYPRTTNTTASRSKRPNHVRRIAVVAVAGVTLGVSGAFAVASAEDDSTAPVACGTTAADLQRAADAARMLEVQRPDLFAQSPRPADHEDLQLAAEWSARMSALDADGQPGACSE